MNRSSLVYILLSLVLILPSVSSAGLVSEHTQNYSPPYGEFSIDSGYIEKNTDTRIEESRLTSFNFPAFDSSLGSLDSALLTVTREYNLYASVMAEDELSYFVRISTELGVHLSSMLEAGGQTLGTSQTSDSAELECQDFSDPTATFCMKGFRSGDDILTHTIEVLGADLNKLLDTETSDLVVLLADYIWMDPIECETNIDSQGYCRATNEMEAISYTATIAYNYTPAISSEVPEPAILALIGLGLAGIGSKRHKKINSWYS